MFTNYFYHGTTRAAIGAFGTLFNNISIQRKSQDNKLLDTIRVPIAYGPRPKWIARIDEQRDFNDPKLAIHLPRMSFEITGISYDGQNKLSRYNTGTLRESFNNEKSTTILQHVPYIINISLAVYAKTQDDGLQVIEQILPVFQPQHTLSLKYVKDIEKSFDMPITLEGVSFDDEYEGDFTSRRVIVYSLDFTLKVKYFSGTDNKSVIRQVDVDIYDIENREKMDRIRAEVNPADAETREDADEPTINYFMLGDDEFDD